MVFGRSGGVRGVAWTIRCDSLELWRDLVSHGMGEVDFHVFWKYWKLTSSPNTSNLVFGPPDWSSFFFESQGTISGAIKPIHFPKNGPKQKKLSGKLENLPKSSFFDKMGSFFLGPQWTKCSQMTPGSIPDLPQNVKNTLNNQPDSSLA